MISKVQSSCIRLPLLYWHEFFGIKRGSCTRDFTVTYPRSILDLSLLGQHSSESQPLTPQQDSLSQFCDLHAHETFTGESDSTMGDWSTHKASTPPGLSQKAAKVARGNLNTQNLWQLQFQGVTCQKNTRYRCSLHILFLVKRLLFFGSPISQMN